jgi:hypothetical protein
VELGSREQFFLALIANEPSSAYKLYSSLKSKRNSMAYKNVHKRVKRLEQLSLISEIKSDSSHGAKFYRLTSEGLFYLLSKFPRIPLTWLIQYKDNVILKALIFSYFEERTLSLISVQREISHYLQECCQMVLSTSELIKSIRTDMHKDKEMALKQLEIDLEWHAKTLVFKLVTKETFFLSHFDILYNGVWYLRIEPTNSMTNQRRPALANDTKFMKFSEGLGVEYQKEYEKLVEERKQLKDL